MNLLTREMRRLAAGELPDAAEDDLKNAPELSEQSY